MPAPEEPEPDLDRDVARGRDELAPHPADGEVAGVDGCPGGWLVVLVGTTGGPARVRVVERLDDLVADVRTGRVRALAIDMPIGLPDAQARTSDRLLRARLGLRRSSVFPTPVRAVLDAVDYADACARSRAACGKALSKQAWNLVPKIRALDALVTPSLQDMVTEAHPETCFAAIAGAPLLDTKATATGRAVRRALLEPLFEGVGAPVDAPPRGATAIDVLDAFAAAWTARRVALGVAEWLGDDERDARGLRMRVAI